MPYSTSKHCAFLTTDRGSVAKNSVYKREVPTSGTFIFFGFFFVGISPNLTLMYLLHCVRNILLYASQYILL